MTIPADLIEQARSADLLTIARSYGVTLRRAGTSEFVGPCPTCGGRDRFSVSLKKRLWHCRKCDAGGDVIALVQFLDGCSFQEAVEKLSGQRGIEENPRPVRQPVKATDADDAERLKRDLASAERIASGIAPLIGTPGEAYLRDVRKIDVVAIQDALKRADAIGWHSGVYFNAPDVDDQGHELHGQRLGAIIGIMTDPITAQPTGAISRTYIGPDGRKVLKSKTLGSPAGIIRLTPDDEVLEGLHLAEGLETALAAMSIGIKPMWATGSTALMAKFPVFAGVEALTIIADHDPNGAGEEAARTTEARWRAAKREVRLLRLDRFGDFNDALAEDAA